MRAIGWVMWVESNSFFEPGRLSDLEQRLGLPPEGLTPNNAVVYICGMTGTISATFLRLIDRGFIPDVNAIRDALASHPRPGTASSSSITTPSR